MSVRCRREGERARRIHGGLDSEEDVVIIADGRGQGLARLHGAAIGHEVGGRVGAGVLQHRYIAAEGEGGRIVDRVHSDREGSTANASPISICRREGEAVRRRLGTVVNIRKGTGIDVTLGEGAAGTERSGTQL